MIAATASQLSLVNHAALAKDDEEPQPIGPPALFLRRHNTGRLWFNTGLKRKSSREQQYRWAGFLLGQGFANWAWLCIPLPELLFEKLLQGPTFEVTAPFPLAPTGDAVW